MYLRLCNDFSAPLARALCFQRCISVTAAFIFMIVRYAVRKLIKRPVDMLFPAEAK